MKITHLNKIINLANNDFLSEGGEGKIYIKNNTLFKIFHKTPIPQQKITELKILNKSNIMIPQNLIYKNNKYIGFSMKYADNTIPLCKLFTNTYRDANNIASSNILKLVQNIQKDIQFIHSKNCIIVDGNEFNYLVSKSQYASPYFIDVDSYQTLNYPATAIMPSIRDWHSSGFTQLTDWFSFAIIACQLFVGIHPFKGKHPSYSKKDLKKRMLDNISIFNVETKVPMSARDFSHIPHEYRLWFLDLFEKGNRSTPPVSSAMPRVMTTKTRIEEVKGDLIIQFIREYPQKIINYYSWRGYETTSKHKILFLGGGEPIVIEIEQNKIILHNRKIYKEINWGASQLLLIDNNLFAIHNGKVVQIYGTNVSDCSKLYLGVGYKTWNILPYAHKVLNGLIYQNILGKAHLDFFYKVNGKTNHSIIHIPELDGHRIIDGKHENKVCVIIGFKDGEYNEFILRFDEKYSRYSCIKTEDIDSQDINMTILDNGLGLILEDGKLRLFHNNTDSNKVKIIENGNLNSKMRLCHKGSNVQFYIDNKLYSLRMGGE
jgi:hypothetical protein